MRVIAFIIFSFLAVTAAFAQQPASNSRSELEKRRQGILESIRETQAQLDATKKDKNATIGQLRVLQAKLDARQRLIRNINEEISQIDNSIKTSASEVGVLTQNLDMLKMRYAQSVRYAYRNRSSYNMLAFIFSSSDFNEAIRRMKYLKKYRDYRKQQADEIRYAQTNLRQKIGVLNNQKEQKNLLLGAEEEQRKTIQNETNETNNVVKELKGREKELLADIEKNKKAARQLDNAIANVIKREIEAARKKAEEEERQRRLAEERRKQKEEEDRKAIAAKTGAGSNSVGARLNTGSSSANDNNHAPSGSAATTTNPRYVPSSSGSSTPAPSSSSPAKAAPPARSSESYVLSMTPEAAALSSNFEANRGRLPWPVTKAMIAERFGPSKHPLYNVITDNKGVELLTSPNASVHAVFDGTITGIFYIPGMGQSVMVSHGQFFTVYTRLGTVVVKKGEAVKMKQQLGNIAPNDNGENMMHFEVWKVGKNNVPAAIDPLSWLIAM